MVAAVARGERLNIVLGAMFRGRRHWYHDGDSGITTVVPNSKDEQPGLLTELTTRWMGGLRLQFTFSGELVILAYDDDSSSPTGRSEQEIARFDLDVDELSELCDAIAVSHRIADQNEWVIARVDITRRFAHYVGWPPCEGMSRRDRLRIINSHRCRIFDVLTLTLEEAARVLEP